MAIGDLSKRYGVQPEAARAKTLAVLDKHGELTANTLDAYSGYNSPVFSREARQMEDRGLVEKTFNPQHGKVTFKITELGKQVLTDAIAYREAFVAKKAVSYYDRAYKRIFANLTERRGYWVAGAVHNAFNEERNVDLTSELAQDAKRKFETKIAGIAIAIAELIENEAEEKGSIDGAAFCEAMVKYHESLRQRGINSFFSKEFLTKLMLGRLEHGK